LNVGVAGSCVTAAIGSSRTPAAAAICLAAGLRIDGFPFRRDPDLLERLGVWRQIAVARWERVDAQNERRDVSILLRAQLPRLLGRRRHCLSNLVEEVGDRPRVPASEEIRAAQRRGTLAAFERLAVTRRAFAR
jgi:hypothetical protein